MNSTRQLALFLMVSFHVCVVQANECAPIFEGANILGFEISHGSGWGRHRFDIAHALAVSDRKLGAIEYELSWPFSERALRFVDTEGRVAFRVEAQIHPVNYNRIHRAFDCAGRLIWVIEEGTYVLGENRTSESRYHYRLRDPVSENDKAYMAWRNLTTLDLVSTEGDLIASALPSSTDLSKFHVLSDRTLPVQNASYEAISYLVARKRIEQAGSDIMAKSEVLIAYTGYAVGVGLAFKTLHSAFKYFRQGRPKVL